MGLLSQTVLRWIDERIAEGKKVYWVCGDYQLAGIVKAGLSEKTEINVAAVSLSNFIQERWDIEGDGRRIVTSLVRELLVADVMKRDSGLKDGYLSESSSDLIHEVSAFIKGSVQAHALDIGNEDDISHLTFRERFLIEVTRDYLDAARSRGLVEEAEAMSAIAMHPTDYAIVFDDSIRGSAAGDVLLDRASNVLRSDEGPFFSSDIVRGFSLSSEKRRHPEIDELERNLDLPGAKVSAEGAVKVALAQNPCREAALIAHSVGTKIEEGVSPGDIYVYLPKRWRQTERLLEASYAAKVPLIIEAARSLLDTCYGEQMFVFSKILQNDGTIAQDAAKSFFRNPLSGFSEKEAQLFDRTVRQRRLSDIDDLLVQARRLSKEVGETFSLFEAFLLAPSPGKALTSLEVVEARVLENLDRRMPPDSPEAKLERSAMERLRCAVAEGAAAGLFFDMRLLKEVTFDTAVSNGLAEPLCSVRASMTGRAPFRHYDTVVIAGLAEDGWDSHRFAQDKDPYKPFSAMLKGVHYPRADDRKESLLRDIVSCAERSIILECVLSARGSLSDPGPLVDSIFDLYREPGEYLQPDIPRQLQPSLIVMEEGQVFESTSSMNEGLLRWRQGILGGGKRYTSRTRGELHDLDDLLASEHEFSATEIERYLECPYRWFYMIRINPKNIDTSFGAVERGRIFHGALDLFYRRLTSECGEEQCFRAARVTSENLDQAKLLLAGCVDEYIATNKERVYVRNTQEQQSVERYKRELLGFIERDASFLPGYAPVYFEFAFGSQKGRAVSYAGVPVKGKIDRVDKESGSGRVVVTDYKSSGVERYGLPEFISDTTSVQAQLYAAVVSTFYDSEPVGSIYRSILRSEARGPWDRRAFPEGAEAGLDGRDGIPTAKTPDGAVGAYGDYKDYLRLTEEYVAGRLSRLLEGDIAPAPRGPKASKPCGHCPARHLCGGAI